MSTTYEMYPCTYFQTSSLIITYLLKNYFKYHDATSQKGTWATPNKFTENKLYFPSKPLHSRQKVYSSKEITWTIKK